MVGFRTGCGPLRLCSSLFALRTDEEGQPVTDSMATAQARREYDAYAPLYDRETGWYERIMLGDGRAWACSQVRGDVLEVAIGTGRARRPTDQQTRQVAPLLRAEGFRILYRSSSRSGIIERVTASKQ